MRGADYSARILLAKFPFKPNNNSGRGIMGEPLRWFRVYSFQPVFTDFLFTLLYCYVG